MVSLTREQELQYYSKLVSKLKKTGVYDLFPSDTLSIHEEYIVVSMMCITILEIFNRMRSTLYTRKKHLNTLLNHILSVDTYPPFLPNVYRKYIKVNTNPIHLKLEDIIRIDEEVPHLFITEKNLKGTAYEKSNNHIFYLSHDDGLMLPYINFTKIYAIYKLENPSEETMIYRTILDIFISPITVSLNDYIGLDPKEQPLSTLLKIGANFYNGKNIQYPEGRTLVLGIRTMIRIVPNKGTRKKLLLDGRLIGKYKIYHCLTCMDQYKYNSSNYYHDKVILYYMVNFTNFMLSNVKDYTTELTIKKLNNKAFTFDIDDIRTKSFIIRSNIPDGYVSRFYNRDSVGYLPKQIDCQERMLFECIDIEYRGYDPYDYIHQTVYNHNVWSKMRYGINLNNIGNILNNIPNLCYMFSDTQQRLISEENNTVVVGRSGTGKTTCAVMRMIGLRLLILSNIYTSSKKTKLKYEELCNVTGERMVFITASPHLARTVGKMYHRILDYLKGLLYEKQYGKKAVDKKKDHIDEEVRMHSDQPSSMVDGDSFEKISYMDDDDMGESRDHPRTLEESIEVVKDLVGEFDIKILEEAEREIDDMIGDIDVEKDGDDIPNSFSKVKINDFPLFLTVKEFMYLLDSLQEKSFFERTAENVLSKGIDVLNGRKGLYRNGRTNIQSSNRMFDDILLRDMERFEKGEEQHEMTKLMYSEDEEDLEYERSEELRRISMTKQLIKDNTTKNIMQNKKRISAEEQGDKSDPTNILSTDIISEVEFEEFSTVFWPQMISNLHWNQRSYYTDISPGLAWPMVMNNEETKDNRTLNIRASYLEWKTSNGYFDLNDLQANLNDNIFQDRTTKKLIDFLFIDEIQDIPVDTLKFFINFASQRVYLSGDNAQNIAKGMNLNFTKLSKSLNLKRSTIGDNNNKTHTLSNPNLYHLTVNYRSHQQILNVGNNLVFHMRLFFSDKIEFMPPEESSTSGPKPIVLSLGSKVDDLRDFLLDGLEVSREFGRYRFFSSQVFITRDNESKLKIEREFPGSMAFTILEAKGMEFDDVILFNYFTDSKSRASWSVFSKCLSIQTYTADRWKEPEFFNNKIDYSVTQDKQSKDQHRVLIEKDQSLFKSLSEKYKDTFLDEASDELKLLYVGVTRSRWRLIIFDELIDMDPSKHNRSYFDEVWRQLDIVSYPTDENNLSLFKQTKPKSQAKEGRY